MRVGVAVPMFQPHPEPALTAARAAEASGLDGAFAYDHIFVLGQSSRPAQSVWPVLGALAAETERLVIGPLVARVGLLPPAVLSRNLESLRRMAGDRLIAGLGCGDRLSEAENYAIGVAFPPVQQRLQALREACSAARRLGIRTWVGGLSQGVREVAVAAADGLNLWAVDPQRVAAETEVEVTWGGVLPSGAGAAGALLERLADAGATWAICALPHGETDDPLPAVAHVAQAARALR